MPSRMFFKSKILNGVDKNRLLEMSTPEKAEKNTPARRVYHFVPF